MLVLVLIFAGAHSGLASFRDTGEKLIGERAYRVLFAGTSLPLALTMIVSLCAFFISISGKKNINIYNDAIALFVLGPKKFIRTIEVDSNFKLIFSCPCFGL
jgi:hypothetical protein